MSSSLATIGPDEKKRLEDGIAAGVRVKQEMADLRDGLKDTVKSLAEEVGLKPAILHRVINTAFKASLEEDRSTHDMVEEILTLTGHA